MVIFINSNFFAPAAGTFPLPHEWFVFPWLFPVIANIRRTFGTLEKNAIFSYNQNFRIYGNLENLENAWKDTLGYPQNVPKDDKNIFKPEMFIFSN